MVLPFDFPYYPATGLNIIYGHLLTISLTVWIGHFQSKILFLIFFIIFTRKVDFCKSSSYFFIYFDYIIKINKYFGKSHLKNNISLMRNKPISLVKLFNQSHQHFPCSRKHNHLFIFPEII